MNKKLKILIVDDTDSTRDMFKNILEKNGHEVLVGYDGKVGIQIIKENADINLVLTDYEMPEQDGFDVLSSAKKRLPHAKLWMSSGIMEDGLRKRAIEAGAEEAFYKPEYAQVFRKHGLIK